MAFALSPFTRKIRAPLLGSAAGNPYYDQVPRAQRDKRSVTSESLDSVTLVLKD
jgi:hypothetical protein